MWGGGNVSSEAPLGQAARLLERRDLQQALIVVLHPRVRPLRRSVHLFVDQPLPGCAGCLLRWVSVGHHALQAAVRLCAGCVGIGLGLQEIFQREVVRQRLQLVHIVEDDLHHSLDVAGDPVPDCPVEVTLLVLGSHEREVHDADHEVILRLREQHRRELLLHGLGRRRGRVVDHKSLAALRPKGQGELPPLGREHLKE